MRRSPSAQALRYFVALGSGFMMAAVVLEMMPEGLAVNPHWAPVLILAGYCGVHLLEHTLVPHFHFGEETHDHEHVSSEDELQGAAGAGDAYVFRWDCDWVGVCGVAMAGVGAVLCGVSA